MTHIFINTKCEFPIGKTILGEIFPTSKDKPVMAAIKVIRAATIEEYVSWVNSKDLGHMINRSIFDMKFYLVELLD